MANVVALIILISLHCNGGYTSHFTNYSLYEVYTYNNRERAYLYWIYRREKTCNFYTLLTNEAALPMSVIVKERHINQFEHNLRSGGVQFNYRSTYRLKEADNVKIDDSIVDPSSAFMTLEGIHKWNEAIDISTTIVQKRIIGVTYNREDIELLKISTGPKKFGLFIIGGEDPKDWMSTAVLLNFVYTLIRNTTYYNILDYYDIYVVANSNPDGYKYNMEVDRLWTKNRKVIFPQKMCSDIDRGPKEAVGVNIDRNWYFNLDEESYADIECDPIFLGETPLSEQESKAIFDDLNSIAAKLMAFISVKGFGKMITIPFANKQMGLTNNHNLMMEILSAVSDTLKEKYDDIYLYGTTASLLHKYTGNAADWVKNKLNVPVVYTVHLQIQDHIFPDTLDIAPLTDQLLTIINQTLMLAKDIYGPLFNNQTKNSISLHGLMFHMLILFIF